MKAFLFHFEIFGTRRGMRRLLVRYDSSVEAALQWFFDVYEVGPNYRDLQMVEMPEGTPWPKAGNAVMARFS